ncbi:hypothetical protein SCHPADRAFT_906896 [Schizopora paradoxa]|uniref:Uncharacterized protein n=1 Tax=Schizopora paradoxa TaxID=27342 RepID=A0A0H2RLZ3_9AGAM|nr:hypothetical protein SCHPADRAFT_906896 [Schizopora paradoxa]
MDGDFRLKHDMPMKWLEAIFTRRRRPNEMIGGGETRTFPNVVKLHLELTEEGQYIPYEKVFKAVPQVRDLTLELPNCDAPSTHHELDTGERLTDVRFANCNSFSGEEVLDFFKTRSKDEEPWFENLQRFEIENCEGLRDSKNEFENLFGDALVWKA